MGDWQKLKAVTKEEFDAFIAQYPRPLTRHLTTICSPEQLSYNDWTLGIWPTSVVAYYFVGDPPGAEHYYGPAKGWHILAAAKDAGTRPSR